MLAYARQLLSNDSSMCVALRLSGTRLSANSCSMLVTKFANALQYISQKKSQMKSTCLQVAEGVLHSRWEDLSTGVDVRDVLVSLHNLMYINRGAVGRNLPALLCPAAQASATHHTACNRHRTFA